MVRVIAALSFLLMANLLVAEARATVPEGNGYLGVQVKLGPDGKGIQVVEPLADAPAAKAGIKAGDVITQVNGKEVNALTTFIALVRDTKPDTRITLTVQRGTQEIRVRVTVGKRP